MYAIALSISVIILISPRVGADQQGILMTKSENIYLVGLMGAGKTTIGRQLAKALSIPFYDSDKAIEERTGVDIPTIFEFEGEEGRLKVA